MDNFSLFQLEFGRQVQWLGALSLWALCRQRASLRPEGSEVSLT